MKDSNSLPYPINKPYPKEYYEDYIGKRFGRLTVVKFLRRTRKNNSNTKVEYLCKCDCGEECVKSRKALKSASYPSCGCWQKERQQERLEKQEQSFKDIEGQRFGRLIVLKLIPRKRDARGFYVRTKGNEIPKMKYLCQCDCGNLIKVTRGDLLHYNTTSCGCLHRQRFRKPKKPKTYRCHHQLEVCKFGQNCCCWDCPVYEQCNTPCSHNPAKCSEYRE